LSLAKPGVLGNDYDVDGDPLTSVLVSGPAHGTLALNPDGSFTYTPAENFCGEDSFTYKAYDGALYSNVATVRITVTCVNDAPVANDDEASVLEDSSVTIPVLGNDYDVDGDPLSVSIVSGPANGRATVNPDGTITYTPNPDFCGTDSFTYKACDPSGACDTATVTITVTCVNDAPVAQDDTYTTNEDTPLLVPAPGILGNDYDVDGDSAHRCLGLRPRPRYPRSQPRWLLHLHACGELLRRGLLHLQGLRWSALLQRGHSEDHGNLRERCAGSQR